MTRYSVFRTLMLLLALEVAQACRKTQPDNPVPTQPTADALAAKTTESAPTPVAAAPPQTREVAALPSLAPLVEAVKAAVINVEVKSQSPSAARTAVRDPFQDFFDRFFGQRGPQSQPRDQIRAGLGSGFLIDPTGVALTNNHVVVGAISIRVRLNDGRDFEAEVLGRDPLTDVAVIKLKGNPSNLPQVQLGDSEAMRVGDWVVAIGNPFGLASSVSAGILSAKDRVIGAGPYDDFLQTDAAINPGNSGGPLFNLRGEVIGINTAIVGRGSGIGFAVPSTLAKALLPQLEKDGHVTRGWLGIGAQELTPELAKAIGTPAKEGAVVVQVDDGTPAAKAGLKPEDVIVAVDGQAVKSHSALTRLVALKTPGTTVNVTYWRGNQKEEAKVTLGTRPDLEGLGSVGSSGSSDEDKRQAQIGLQLEDVDPSLARSSGAPTQGALIADVAPGSLAELAGLTPGAVVIEAGGKPVRSAADLKKAIRDAQPGSVLLLRVQTPGGKALRALNIPK
jgi:serine protease Do